MIRNQMVLVLGCLLTTTAMYHDAFAQRGGHSGGHAGGGFSGGGASHMGGGNFGAAPSHFYGSASGLHVPIQRPYQQQVPQLPRVPNSGFTQRSAGVSPGLYTPQVARANQFARPRTNQLNLNRRFNGYPAYYSSFGFGGLPYFTFGYGLPNYFSPYYGYGASYYGRPYYYGYLQGVPYMSYNNYAPSYYNSYNLQPGGSNAPIGIADIPASKIADEAAENAGDTLFSTNDAPAITDAQAKEYLLQSENELSKGDYVEAIQHAGEAAFELHEDSRVHEVLWLALMGVGDYRGAAIEAHAVDHFGVTPSWNDVAMKHEDKSSFANQMQKLEVFVKRNQDSDFAAFLLGYNYLVLGHRDAAKQWLEAALRMDPQDTLCRKLISSLSEDSSHVAKPEVGLLPSDLSQR